MSSSPSRAPSLAVPRPVQESEVSAFFYNEAVVCPDQVNFASPAKSAPEEAAVKTDGPGPSDAERERQWRELGRKEGAAESRARFDEQLGQERAAVVKAVFDFSQERAAYYRKIEEEAVRLALSIARKILHREANLDPLLLLGVVRAALDRIEGATDVTLLVNPRNAAEWKQTFRAQAGSGELPEMVETPSLPVGQCVLKTSMGTADLGLELQLKEIETGLMDLLAARPGGAAKA